MAKYRIKRLVVAAGILAFNVGAGQFKPVVEVLVDGNLAAIFLLRDECRLLRDDCLPPTGDCLPLEGSCSPLNPPLNKLLG